MTNGHERCISCRHFHNTPRYLEQTYKGLSTFSSGYASVRKDDGICLEHSLYLSASSWCNQYTARTQTV